MQFIDLAKQQYNIRERIESRIKTVLDHGVYIMGPEVFELEAELARYVNVKYCISCSSGTDALLIPLMAKGIGPGDAVFTSPFTFIATAEIIKLLGATPVFVDIYPDTFNINPELIPNAVEFANKKGLIPKAIIPVDLFGLPARYRLIDEQSKKYNLFVLEDAAQGFGGEIRGQKAGSFCHVAATSFFPAKPLGCYGDGGAIFTNDEKIADLMKSIRVHGGGSDKYDNLRIGINGRLDTFQAAILLEKLAVFPIEIKKRNTVADYYTDNILNPFKVPCIPEGYHSSWAQFSIMAESKQHRDFVIKELKDKTIPTAVYYRIPLHLQRVFSDLGYQKGDFPVAEKTADHIFSIPMHPYLDRVQQDKILEVLNAGA